MNSRASAVAATLLLVLELAACQGVETVDGWPLGKQIECEMTINELDARDALAREIAAKFGSAEIVDQRCFFPGHDEVDGNEVLWETAPGGVELHVLTFADSSRHVIPLGCPGRLPPFPGQPPVNGPRCLVIARP